MKFRKKPIYVEAEQWDGTYQEMKRLEKKFQLIHARASYHMKNNTVATWEISTREGRTEVRRGDWIIKGIEGEPYPCNPDIFWATYEEASNE